MASKPDVIVVGAGIFGLSCAWELVRRGASVRVMEARRIGSGASGGVVGALAPHVPERWNTVKAFQFASLLGAKDFWADVARASGRDPGYARLGRLQPISDEAGLERARERAEDAKVHWQGKANWRVFRAEDAGPWAPVSPTGWLIEDTLSARIAPGAGCAALAAALAASGAEVIEGLPGDPAAAGPVLWATGAAGLEMLSCDTGRAEGRGIKGQAALVALDRRCEPQIYADGLHIVPHADGTTAIGSTTERDYDAAETTDAQLDDVIVRACAVVPALAGAPVLQRWAGLRPRARSRAPLLGAWPGRPGHFVANGGFKIGFGMAPGVAHVMADFLLDGRDSIPEDFRLTAP